MRRVVVNIHKNEIKHSMGLLCGSEILFSRGNGWLSFWSEYRPNSASQNNWRLIPICQQKTPPSCLKSSRISIFVSLSDLAELNADTRFASTCDQDLDDAMSDVRYENHQM